MGAGAATTPDGLHRVWSSLQRQCLRKCLARKRRCSRCFRRAWLCRDQSSSPHATDIRSHEKRVQRRKPRERDAAAWSNLYHGGLYASQYDPLRVCVANEVHQLPEDMQRIDAIAHPLTTREDL